LARAFFNENSNSLPAWLALAVNMGAAAPFDFIDWAKPGKVIKRQKTKTKTGE
jgi:hypothetical protein